MLTIRCSSTDRVMACASSLAHSDHPYTPNNAEAREGQAAHAALAVVVAGAEPDLEAIATEYQVDRDELASLVSRGRKAWLELHGYFPEAVPERHMAFEIADDIDLRGTADVASIVETATAVLDWKAGWRPSEHPHQLKSYAYLASRFTDHEWVLAVEVWLRLGTFRVHRWSRTELEAHAAQLVAQTRRVGDQWGPSPSACQYCPLQLTCRARADYLEGGVAGLVPYTGNRYPVSIELVAQLWDRAVETRRGLERFFAVAEALLDEHGSIPLDGGRELRRVASERTRVRPVAAMAFLRERLTPEQADEVISVSKSALCDAIKAGAPHGKGAAAIRGAMAELEAAGALETYIHTEKRVTTREEK
jgi:hypothetical protein